MSHQVVLFYNYTDIENPQAEKDRHTEFCSEHNLKGRFIIAHEGINATFEGDADSIKAYKSWLTTDTRFVDTHFKQSPGNGHTFSKLSVKVRPEIVSLHLDNIDVDPKQTTGKYLTADELHRWFAEKKEFYIIDMRNDYESKVGHFANSLLPTLTNFRDLPKILPQLAHLKDKTVLTVCTGGIRCEKASGLLIQHGFKDVYQLFGGIHTYMEKYPNQDFLGKLYVFDERVTIGFNVDAPEHRVIAICDICAAASDHYVDCSNIHCTAARTTRHFICCKNCLDEEGSALCVDCRI